MQHSKKFLAFFGALLCTLPLLMGPTGGTTAPRTRTCLTTCSIAAMRVGDTTVAFATSGTARASTITLADDVDLLLTSAPTGWYEVTAAGQFSAGAGGARYAMRGGGNFILGTVAMNCAAVMSNASSNSGGDTPAHTCATSPTAFLYQGEYQVSGGAPSLGLQWAQNTSDVSNTVIQTYSYFKVVRIR